MFLLYMGVVAILVMGPRPNKLFCFMEAQHVIWFPLSQRFQGDVLWKNLKILNLRHPGQREVNDHDLLWPWLLMSQAIIESEKSTFAFLPYKSVSHHLNKLDRVRPNMLHTKFQGHQLFSSCEDFKGFLPYIGIAAILVRRSRPYK